MPVQFELGCALSGPDGSRHSSDQHPKDLRIEIPKIQISVRKFLSRNGCSPEGNSRDVEDLCFYGPWIFAPPPETLPSLPGTEIQIYCLFCRFRLCLFFAFSSFVAISCSGLVWMHLRSRDTSGTHKSCQDFWLSPHHELLSLLTRQGPNIGPSCLWPKFVENSSWVISGQSSSRTLKNRGRPRPKRLVEVLHPRWGRNFLTPWHLGMRVWTSAGNPDLKGFMFCFFPDAFMSWLEFCTEMPISPRFSRACPRCLTTDIHMDDAGEGHSIRLCSKQNPCTQ